MKNPLRCICIKSRDSLRGDRERDSRRGMKARNAVRFSISAVERKKRTRLFKSFFFHVSNRCLKGKGSDLLAI